MPPFADAKRIVVKVGSRILTGGGPSLDPRRFDLIARGISGWWREGRAVALVSSGAIAAGTNALGLARRPDDLATQQAAAAVGQGRLMWEWQSAFLRYGRTVGQVLLTGDVTRERARYLNARNTLLTLFRLGVAPVINENDTVSVEEIQFGDNDHLSAIVSNLVGADLLVILSDVPGLFTADPRSDPAARLVPEVAAVTPEVLALAGGTEPGGPGKGGMRTKVLAARTAADMGARTLIVPGADDALFDKLSRGENVGTLFHPARDPLSSRKHWLLYGAAPEGQLRLDEGARRALVDRGKSLLPSGITGVSGEFGEGALVILLGPDGVECARGLTHYSSADIERIRGRQSGDIEAALGRKGYEEVVHRDHLALTGGR
ncbi:MAG: glutamate 5-kinase [Planctomycetes bacterium]|nr:glutamate 5-kinase [Planctomycetota bacterium]